MCRSSVVARWLSGGRKAHFAPLSKPAPPRHTPQRSRPRHRCRPLHTIQVLIPVSVPQRPRLRACPAAFGASPVQICAAGGRGTNEGRRSSIAARSAGGAKPRGCRRDPGRRYWCVHVDAALRGRGGEHAAEALSLVLHALLPRVLLHAALPRGEARLSAAPLPRHHEVGAKVAQDGLNALALEPNRVGLELALLRKLGTCGPRASHRKTGHSHRAHRAV